LTVQALGDGGIKIITMNTKLKAILGLASISLLIYTTYEQNKTINSQKFEIDSLKKQYDSLYTDHWALKTYSDIKEGRAEE
jgi:hypothetical protein